MIPKTGVVDYKLAFLLNMLFARIPITPVTMASRKHLLNPIILKYHITYFSMYEPNVSTPMQVSM
jgi:hypothetical protein